MRFAPHERAQIASTCTAPSVGRMTAEYIFARERAFVTPLTEGSCAWKTRHQQKDAMILLFTPAATTHGSLNPFVCMHTSSAGGPPLRCPGSRMSGDTDAR